MTAPYQRSSVEGVLGNHEKRVGILEAVSLGAHYEIKVVSDLDLVTTGDSQFVFAIPSDVGDSELVDAQAFVSTASSSGKPTVQIRNVTLATDMLSTKITIDVSEFTSYSAAVPSVVNAANGVVATGDLIAIDVDVAGTGAKGLGVILVFL
mgnify:FL=1